MNRVIVFIVLAVVATSCLGYNPREIFTPLKEGYKADCVTQPAEVQLIFDGEQVDFQYDRIGLIEVQAEYTGKEADQLKTLTNLAKSKCCDAVIGIKKGYITRDMGLIFTNEPNQSYQAVSFSGIAVKKR